MVEGSLGPAALVAVCVLGVLFLSLLATLLLSRTRHKETVAKVWLGRSPPLLAYVVIDVVGRLDPDQAAVAAAGSG